MALGPLLSQDLGVKCSGGKFGRKSHQKTLQLLGVAAPKSWNGIGCLEKFRLKIRFYPQMEKIDACVWWVHILGLRCRPNKVPHHTFIPYQY